MLTGVVGEKGLILVLKGARVRLQICLGGAVYAEYWGMWWSVRGFRFAVFGKAELDQGVRCVVIKHDTCVNLLI